MTILTQEEVEKYNGLVIFDNDLRLIPAKGVSRIRNAEEILYSRGFQKGLHYYLASEYHLAGRGRAEICEDIGLRPGDFLYLFAMYKTPLLSCSEIKERKLKRPDFREGLSRDDVKIKDNDQEKIEMPEDKPEVIVNPQKNLDINCGFTYSSQGNNIQNASLENYKKIKRIQQENPEDHGEKLSSYEKDEIIKAYRRNRASCMGTGESLRKTAEETGISLEDISRFLEKVSDL